MTEMLVFAGAVCRGARRALVVGDMPFLSYQPSDACAVRNAGAFVRAGCAAVKCEGGRRVARRVRAMTDAGIAVMGHVGLTPQNLAQLGGYRVQGKTRAAVDALVDDARALEAAGAFAVLVEAVPPEAGAAVRDALAVPVYGIGAGPHVDGQLLIAHDLLGSFVGDIRPRFAKRYAEVGAAIEGAFRAYADDVRARRFPGPEHWYAGDGAGAADPGAPAAGGAEAGATPSGTTTTPGTTTPGTALSGAASPGVGPGAAVPGAAAHYAAPAPGGPVAHPAPA
jgi:3-methyl-2-oxobutanoate hydroxymethyltransferase